MKLLMFHATRFEHAPHVNVLSTLTADDDVPAQRGRPGTGATFDEPSVVVFMHAEPDDLARGNKLVTRCAKNIKWLANKRALKTVVLHSFDHLSEDKAPPEEAAALIESVAERLRSAGYDVHGTAFGYSSSWTLGVHGDAIAKVFKSI